MAVIHPKISAGALPANAENCLGASSSLFPELCRHLPMAAHQLTTLLLQNRTLLFGLASHSLQHGMKDTLTNSMATTYPGT